MTKTRAQAGHDLLYSSGARCVSCQSYLFLALRSSFAPRSFLFFSFSKTCPESEMYVRRGYGHSWTGRHTSNSSSFASLTASALMVLNSRGVKEVPPPLGKSTSSAARRCGAVEGPASATFGFLLLREVEGSSKVRFWAGIACTAPTLDFLAGLLTSSYLVLAAISWVRFYISPL